MSIFSKLKDEHMSAASKRWDDALKGARRFFEYDNPAWSTKHSQRVRELAHALLSSRDLYELLGGLEESFDIKMNGYLEYAHGGPVARLEFVRFFIGHEILDDGEPGLAYYRNTITDKGWTGGMFALCGPEHPKAMPYFHRHLDTLREDYPDAEGLSLEVALRAVAAHASRHPKTAEGILPHWRGTHDERDLEYMIHGTKGDQQMLALANALRDESPPLGAAQ